MFSHVSPIINNLSFTYPRKTRFKRLFNNTTGACTFLRIFNDTLNRIKCQLLQTDAFLNSIYRSTTDFETIECLIKSASFPLRISNSNILLGIRRTEKRVFERHTHVHAHRGSAMSVRDSSSRFDLAVRGVRTSES